MESLIFGELCIIITHVVGRHQWRRLVLIGSGLWGEIVSLIMIRTSSIPLVIIGWTIVWRLSLWRRRSRLDHLDAYLSSGLGEGVCLWGSGLCVGKLEGWWGI